MVNFWVVQVSETAGRNNAKNRKRLRQMEKFDGDAIVVFVQDDDRRKKKKEEEKKKKLKVKLLVL